MDEAEFRKRGLEMVDYLVNYLDSVSQRPVTSNVSPGYLADMLPPTAPQEGESFEKVMEDVERCIMPGLTHWQHPRFHAYFPASSSYPSILAEMFSDTIGCSGFNWNICPAGVEIESIVLDWFAKMIGLPDQFLRYAEGSIGGGIIQNSSSECILLSMLKARDDILKKLHDKDPSSDKASLLPSLVAYCSKESHSCVEKDAMMLMVTIRLLDTDDDFRLRGETFAKAVEEDKKKGLIPFYASITLGTTSCCACDPIDEIGPVCKENDIWLNVDAAYGGTALVCPEFRHLLKGVEYASSFNVNSAKWLLVNLECAVMFVTDRSKIHDSVVTDRTMFAYGSDDNDDWVHPSNRRCRAFKLWFVIRSYGIEGLQAHVRNHVRLAVLFADHVRNDSRFEFLTCQFGLVCFRLKGSNALTRKFLKAINDSAKLHMIPCCLKGQYVVRFCVCYSSATEDDIHHAWNVIDEFATELLETHTPDSENSD